MSMNAEIADSVGTIASLVSEKNVTIFRNSSGSLRLLLVLGLGFPRYDQEQADGNLAQFNQMKGIVDYG